MDKVRVVHLLTSLNYGGISSFLYQLIGNLKSQGVESHTLLTLARGDYAPKFQSLGVPIHMCEEWKEVNFPLSYTVGKIIRNLPRLTFQRRLIKTLRLIKPDLIHSHYHGRFWKMQLRAAIKLGIPIIFHIHSPSSAEPGDSSVTRYFKSHLRDRDRFVVPSSGVREAYLEFLNLFPNNIRNLAYGMAVIEDNHIKKKKTVTIGYVGRLIPPKQVGLLIKALSLLKNKISFKAIIVGDGDERIPLEKQTHDSGLDEYVRFVGYQKNPFEWLAKMDIFVLPSAFEGFSISLIEAMNAGLPLVGTDVSGTREAILDGINGFLVPNKDAITLCQRLYQIVHNSDLRTQMGKASKNIFMENYEIQACASRYLDLYREVNSK